MNIVLNDECFCLHSTSQIIDIFVQCYIYAKGFVSEPVTKILNDSNERMYSKFLSSYINFQQVLQSIFKTSNIELIKELQFIIGSNNYLPEEVIKIPIKYCHVHKGVPGERCQENCRSLNEKEQRSFYRTFVSQFHILNDHRSKKNLKFFMYIITDNKLKEYSDFIEESDEPEYLDNCKDIKFVNITFKNSCNNNFLPHDIPNPIYYRWEKYFSIYD
uniref:Uncharacterized protein n=1 Tax=Parastrongyloides trichosuri TaxID=131310 RepID=A0A0N4ZGY9_PARTI